MGNSGIGHTSYRIRCHIIPLCHTGSTVTAHLFYTDTLIDAGRISIIDPQKCTDLHILSGSSQCTDFLRCHYHNLAGTKFPFGFITQIQISKAFKCYTISIFFPFCHGQRRYPLESITEESWNHRSVPVHNGYRRSDSPSD